MASASAIFLIRDQEQNGLRQLPPPEPGQNIASVVSVTTRLVLKLAGLKPLTRHRMFAVRSSYTYDSGRFTPRDFTLAASEAKSGRLIPLLSGDGRFCDYLAKAAGLNPIA